EGLDYIAAQLAERELSDRVSLRLLAADELSALKGQTFDCVVINSVAQYFPSREYLDSVLESASTLLSPQGTIFVGDVNNLDLAGMFYESVLRHETPDAADTVISARASRHRAEDTELLVHPAYFTELPERIPRLRRVETSVKFAHGDHQPIRFRYDVTLHTDDEALAVTEFHRWGEDDVDLRWMAETIAKGVDGDYLAVAEIPNAHLHADPDAVHPDELRDVAEGTGLETLVTWSPSGPPGSLAVVCHVPGTKVTVDYAGDGPVTSDPARGAAARDLPRALRQRLRDILPDYMVPAKLVPLAHMPVGSSGKVDRSALEQITEVHRSSLEHTLPRTETERLVAEVFGAVLNIPSVAVEDNIFDLGGDSIKVIQAAVRLRDAGLPVMVRSIFANQTVGLLAEFLDTDVPAPEPVPAPQRIRDLPADTFPASPLQEHMMSVAPERVSNGLYVVQRILRYHGEIDLPTVRSAWQETVDNVPFLRAVLRRGTDGFVQTPGAAVGGSITALDWSD
ncbi:MAG: phosphopantetheine-binding protein, partial [Stackebrandtia sp.]